jgi:hypothetical protein
MERVGYAGLRSSVASDADPRPQAVGLEMFVWTNFQNSLTYAAPHDPINGVTFNAFTVYAFLTLD